MTRRDRRGLWALCLLSAFTLASCTCGKNPLTDDERALSSVAVTPASPSLAKGATQQLTATAHYSDGTSEDVTSRSTWASASAAVASVSAAGWVTALGAGTATLTAKFGSKTGAATVTVTSAALKKLEVTPPVKSIAKGTRQSFVATGIYSDGTKKNLTAEASWTSSAATAATVSTNGTRGIATAIDVGTTTITAQVESLSGTAALTVKAATLTSLEVTPATASIAKGTRQQFIVTGVFSDSTTQDLTESATWTSSATGVATVSDADGTKGLAASATSGSTNITAAFLGQSQGVVLTVTDATFVSLALTPSSASIASGTTRQLIATGTFTDNSTQNVSAQATWSSSNDALAAVSSAGLVTGKAEGAPTITATLSGQAATSVITVTAAVVKAIEVAPETPSIANGLPQQFTATAIFTDNTHQNVTADVIWSSSNEAVATISNATTEEGLATSLSLGSTEISATYGAFTDATTFSVTDATLVSLSVGPANPTVALGLSEAFTATGLYTDSATPDLTELVTWSSSNEAVATISNANGSRGEITTLTAGTTHITATYQGNTETTLLTVSAATVKKIEISPVGASIAKGLTQAFVATGVLTDNTTVPLTTEVTWGANGTGVVSISNADGSEGEAFAEGVGTAVITASYGALTDSVSFEVTSATLTGISVGPATASIAKGTLQQFTAEGSFTDGSTAPLTAEATWSTVDPAASVSNADGSEGLATGLLEGAATITASYGGFSATAALTVTAATLDSVTVTPANPSLPVGLTRQFTATANYSDNTHPDVTALASWGSGTPAAATVSNAPGTKGVAAALAVGTSTLTATYDGQPGSTTLTVTAATLQTVTVDPATADVPIGLDQTFTATGHFSDGSTQTLTSSATWSSGTEAVASISNAPGTKGVATTLSAGTSTIRAVVEGVIGTAELTVPAITLTSIAVTPQNPSVQKNATEQLTATGTFSDASTRELTTLVTWSSASSAQVSVNNTTSKGLVTAHSQDEDVVITAALNGTTGTTTVHTTP